MKCKNVMFVQQLEFLSSQSLQEIINEFELQLNPRRIAGIIHDKDKNSEGEIVKKHVHIVMQFTNARSLASLAKNSNQPVQCFEKWTGSVNNAYSYLVHQTKSDQSKHLYDPREVIANFDYVALLENIAAKVSKRSKIKDSTFINNQLDLLYEGIITKEDIENNLSGSQYAKAKQKIDIVYQKYLEKKVKKMERANEKKSRAYNHYLVIWTFRNWKNKNSKTLCSKY